MTTDALDKTEQKETRRCTWAESHDVLLHYHDQEWGVPVHDDRLLFEMLNLEGAQAGLSWLTILKRRDGYRRAFDNFDAATIAGYSAEHAADLLHNTGIIRNRLKVNAVITNAKAFLVVQREFGSFATYIWRFVDNTPILDAQKHDAVGKSDMMSKDLQKRGFKFVGATICYAFMQAVGMINDHSADCFRAARIAL